MGSLIEPIQTSLKLSTLKGGCGLVLNQSGFGEVGSNGVYKFFFIL